MRASPRLAASPPPPMALTSLLLVPLLTVAAGAAAGPQPPHAGPAPGPGPASDAQDDAVDPALVDAEAAWLREADTALLAGQLAQLLRAQGEGAPPGTASDGGPADWAPLLIFDGAAADNDPYLLAAQDGAVGKRSRYYRRYPWKRQPGRGGGASPAVDYDNPYLCNPTREDVFQLLVALHEARAGNLGRTVSFCNRRRPAASVFTNIRFLGRRRRR